jgi:hypothetical protein
VRPPRSRDEQRHDALRNGLRRYLDSGIAGLRDKVAPHLSSPSGSTACTQRPAACRPSRRQGARLPRSLVRRWWCDSAVTRFVLGLGGRVLAASHTGRTLTATERRAKRIETGGACEVAGAPRTGLPARASPPDAVRRVRHDEPVRHGPAVRGEPPRPARRTHGPAAQGRPRLGPDGWLPQHDPG